MDDTPDTGEMSQADESPQPPAIQTALNPHRGPRLSRRQLFVIAAATGAAGTGLAIGLTLHARQGAQAPQRGAKPFTPNVWLRIDPDDTITVTVGRSEMGQGVLTALAMLAADELDADWSRVRTVQAPSGAQYGDQRTTGSGSISGSFVTMRQAGAQARALLVAAAARTWGVDASTCRTERGAVLHPSSGRRLSYGELASAAAAQRFVLPNLKTPDKFRLIGTSVPRLDTADKVDGSARFGLDVRIPGMLFATVARCPVPGGTVATFDASRAAAVPGVRAVVQIPSGVAVVADHTWAAIAGRSALTVTWSEGANAGLASDAIRRQLASQSPQPPLAAGAAHTVSAEYETPYQTHAPMEPLNCTVLLENGTCEVWAGTQDPQGAQAAASDASALPAESVTVHVTAAGGGFGRRASSDFVAETVNVAKAVAKPVQVVWTREDDLRNGLFRPAAHHRLQATLDAAGRPQSWFHGVAAQSMGSPVGTGAELPYSIPSPRISGVDVTIGVSVTIWRGAEFSYTTFAVESFIDELAVAARADPYQFRRRLLGDQPRLQAVLDLAAGKAGWGTPLPAGQGRGIAASMYGNGATFVAEVAEVAVGADGTVFVPRVVCAVDCGLVVNPGIAEAQIEGAIAQGLSAALKGEITFAGGRVQQHNFDAYPLLRLAEMPAIEVHFVPSAGAPGGLGEPALPPIAPAVANAVFAATGRRVRRLPIRASDLR